MENTAVAGKTVAAVPHHKMALTACSSSQVHAHGHCPITNTLVLQFKRSKDGQRVGGTKYSYPCTPEQYAKFCAAESKGRYFADHIKSNPKDHPHTKLPDENGE